MIGKEVRGRREGGKGQGRRKGYGDEVRDSTWATALLPRSYSSRRYGAWRLRFSIRSPTIFHYHDALASSLVRPCFLNEILSSLFQLRSLIFHKNTQQLIFQTLKQTQQFTAVNNTLTRIMSTDKIMIDNVKNI